MEIFKKSANYVKNHKKGIGLVILSGVILAATAVLKNKNKSKGFDLRSYGINKDKR